MIQRYHKFFNKLLGSEILAEDKSIISSGLGTSIFVHAISLVLVFASSIVYVRFAGINNYGIFLTVFSWIAILTAISGFGMEDIVLSEIPKALQQKRFGYVKSVFLHANKIIFIGSLIAGLIFNIIVRWGNFMDLGQYQIYFLWASPAIFFIVFITVNQLVLQAANKIVISQLFDKIIKPLLLIIIIGLLYFLNGLVSAEHLIVINVLVLFFGVIFLFFVPFKYLKSVKESTPENINWKDFRIKKLYFFFHTLLFLLRGKIPIILLALLSSTESVAYFNIVSKLAEIVFIPYYLVHFIVPQMFSKLNLASRAYTKKIYIKLSWIISIASTIILFIVLLANNFLFELYKIDFEYRTLLLVIACVGQLLYSFFGPANSLLMMQGKEKASALAVLFEVVISIGLYIVFITQWGLAGAVYAAFLSSLFYNVYLRLLLKKHF